MAVLPRDSYPWISEDLLKTVLQLSESDGEFIDFEMYDAVGKGENYTSHMIRVLVKYREQNGNSVIQKSFIIKTTLAAEWHTRFEKPALFTREVTFYRDILPNFSKYLKMFDPNFKFAPRPYKTNNESPVYLIFEDLKSSKFGSADRRIGLNFVTTTMLLKKLAIFHAMSALLYEENSELFTVYKKPFLSADDNLILDAYMCGMQDCVELCQLWPGYERLSVKLKKLLKIIKVKIEKAFVRDENEFNVLTHGDLWVNNIMVKSDEQNNPVDVIMVDYQFGFFGSPAIDLSYLLFSSTTNDIREKEWDRLIQIYHVQLTSTLRAIKYPKSLPTLTKIHTEILNRSSFAVLAGLMLLEPRHMEKVEHADLDFFVFDNVKSKRLRHELFNKVEMKERAQYLLDYFDRKGFLE